MSEGVVVVGVAEFVGECANGRKAGFKVGEDAGFAITQPDAEGTISGGRSLRRLL